MLRCCRIDAALGAFEDVRGVYAEGNVYLSGSSEWGWPVGPASQSASQSVHLFAALACSLCRPPAPVHPRSAIPCSPPVPPYPPPPPPPPPPAAVWGSKAAKHKRSVIAMMRLNDDMSKPLERASIMNCSAEPGEQQKNWVPMIVDDKLHYVTRAFPLTIVRIGEHSYQVSVDRRKPLKGA